MHQDAPWCTEMHCDAPRWLYFFYNNFCIAPSATKLFLLLIYFLPAPWCTEMHHDAPSCTVMHRDGFFSSKITYELNRVPPNCFIYFLLAPWCTEMHRDALRCTMMHRNAPWCTVMHRDGFFSSKITYKLHRVPPNWFLLLYWVLICTEMHRDAPWCTEYY